MSDTNLVELLQRCFYEIMNGSVPPLHLLMATLSKGLGFGIIAFACIVKLPQILKINKSKSASGLSMLSFELEQLALSVHATYGFILGLPFSAYGEAVVLILQNTLLLSQIYSYAKAPLWRPMLVLSLFGGAFFCVSAGKVTPSMIKTLYDLNNFVVLAARLPQIFKNYKSKSTGQLSVTVYIANAVGCVARIFTSLQEGGGMAMVRGFLLGLVLNGTLVAQCFAYSGKKPQAKGEQRSKEQRLKDQ